METKVTFQGNEYLLIGNLKEGGSLATEEQYENFELPFAHLMPDGRILRFGVQIGTKEDLKEIESNNI